MKNAEEEGYHFEPSASINELKSFQESHIWRDFVKYIEFRSQGNMSVLKNSLDHRALLRSQGALMVAEDVLNFPDQMIEWALEEQELTKDED